LVLIFYTLIAKNLNQRLQRGQRVQGFKRTFGAGSIGLTAWFKGLRGSSAADAAGMQNNGDLFL